MLMTTERRIRLGSRVAKVAGYDSDGRLHGLFGWQDGWMGLEGPCVSFLRAGLRQGERGRGWEVGGREGEI